MPTRQFIEFAKQISWDRVFNEYIMGGCWNPYYRKAGTDCSDCVGKVCSAVQNGPAMNWGRQVSTENWRPSSMGGNANTRNGPYGSIMVNHPREFPADAAVLMAFHHGDGSAADSHVWCSVDGLRVETHGSTNKYPDGATVIGNEARDPRDTSYANNWWYIPGPIQEDSSPRVNGPSPDPTVPVNPGVRLPVLPVTGGTLWADVSQFQDVPINDFYPYRVFSFRTNDGDYTDLLALRNAKAALKMLDEGKLDIVIPYYFFRPGKANCDLHRTLLEQAGLFNHPKTVSMIDVEGDQGSVRGDNSAEINDEINRIRNWYNNYLRVIGYWNPNADPQLWPNRNINLIIPQYNGTPGNLALVGNVQAKNQAIAHQYTSTAPNVAPWSTKGIDLNWSPYTVDQLLQIFGIKKTQSQPQEQDYLDMVTQDQWNDLAGMITGIYKALTDLNQSQSRYKTDGEGEIWSRVQMIQNDDAMIHEDWVEQRALNGIESCIRLVVRNAERGDPIALTVFGKIDDSILLGLGISRDEVLDKYRESMQSGNTVFSLPPE